MLLEFVMYDHVSHHSSVSWFRSYLNQLTFSGSCLWHSYHFKLFLVYCRALIWGLSLCFIHHWPM
jgi:hypothetical protein